MKNLRNDLKGSATQPAHSTVVSGGNQQKRSRQAKKGKPRAQTKSRPIETHPLEPDRIRKIAGSFAFIEHRFLHDGFWYSLDHHQLLLYLFLIIVSDRNGLSYYSYDKICTLLRISVDEYILARNALIDQNMIAFDGYLFQVLSLPKEVTRPVSDVLKSQKQMQKHDPATVHQFTLDDFWGKS
ncbi:MAG: hypothetical protein H8D67_09200 [Deltaproteobacteria bacterium]|nr:hypothetical protein [Deltaproteobacteria bacterium]